jgi:hypothetical protein
MKTGNFIAYSYLAYPGGRAFLLNLKNAKGRFLELLYATAHTCTMRPATITK